MPPECWGARLVPLPLVPGEKKHQGCPRFAPGRAGCGTGALLSRAATNSPETSQLSGPQGWKPEMSKAGTVHEQKPL